MNRPPPHFIARARRKICKNRKIGQQSKLSVRASSAVYTYGESEDVVYRFKIVGTRAHICKYLGRPRINSMQSIPGLLKKVYKYGLWCQQCIADFENFEDYFLLLGKLLYGPFLGIV
jgi:hypothetical protein